MEAFKAVMASIAENMRKNARRQGMPRGLGGYRLKDMPGKEGLHIVDKKRMTAVRTKYAELIERNKYAPGWEARGKHLDKEAA